MLSSKNFKAKIKVDDIIVYNGYYAILGTVEEGVIQVGDHLVVNIKGKEVYVLVKYLVVFGQAPVYLAYKGEKIIIPVDVEIEVNEEINSVLESYRSYAREIANLAFIHENSDKLNSYLVEESFSPIELDKTTLYLIQHGKYDEYIDKGLKLLSNEGTLWKGAKAIATLTGIAIIARKLWQKFSDPCNRPFSKKEEKIRCLQLAAKRVADELQKEERQCAQLYDPLQRRKCLARIEKIKRQWIQKSAELKVALYKK